MPAMIYLWDWLPLKLIVISYYPPTCHSFSRVHIQFSSFALRTSPSHEVNHYHIYFMYKSSNISIFFPSTPLDRPFSVSRLCRYTLISIFHLFTLSTSRLPTPLDTFPLPLRHKDTIRPSRILFHLDTCRSVITKMVINRPALLFRTRIVLAW